MPGPTTTEFVVTTYVNQNYSGSYRTETVGGYHYRVYDSAPNDFWFDNDMDGWFDYGRRDEGHGNWTTFEGFYWDDTPPPPRHEAEEPEVLDPNGLIAQPELALDVAAEFFLPNPAPYQDDINFTQPNLMNADDGWFL